MADQLEDVGPDDLTPAQWTALVELRTMEPAERERFLGHIRLSAAAWRFLRPAVEHADLRSAWPALDADLRLCLAQQWVVDNATDIALHGYDRAEVAAGLAGTSPDTSSGGTSNGSTSAPCASCSPRRGRGESGTGHDWSAPIWKCSTLHDTSDLPDGVWRPGEVRRVVPLLMRWTGERWVVCNLGSGRTPVPGWPPRL